MRPAVVVAVLLLVACGGAGARPTATPTLPANSTSIAIQTMNQLIPQPTSVQPSDGVFLLTADTAVVTAPATAEVTAIAELLAAHLRPATGYPLPVLPAKGAPASSRRLLLTLDPADTALGEEGYALTITADAVTLTAHQPAGLFYLSLIHI